MATLRHILGPPLILAALLSFAFVLAAPARALDVPDDPVIVALDVGMVELATSLEPTLAPHEAAVLVAYDDRGMVLAIAVMEPLDALAPDRLRVPAARHRLDRHRVHDDVGRALALSDHSIEARAARHRAVLAVRHPLRC